MYIYIANVVGQYYNVIVTISINNINKQTFLSVSAVWLMEDIGY